MAIPNVKRYRITSPDGTMTASLMAVLPKNADVNAYLEDAAKRYDWKAHQEAMQKQFTVRVGQLHECVRLNHQPRRLSADRFTGGYGTYAEPSVATQIVIMSKP